MDEFSFPLVKFEEEGEEKENGELTLGVLSLYPAICGIKCEAQIDGLT